MEKMRNSDAGPNDATLTLEDLPSPDTARWVPRKKAAIVAAVRGGLLSLSEACERYALTLEEFTAWQEAIDHFGLRGLQRSHSRVSRQAMPNSGLAKPGASLTASGAA